MGTGGLGEEGTGGLWCCRGDRGAVDDAGTGGLWYRGEEGAESDAEGPKPTPALPPNTRGLGEVGTGGLGEVGTGGLL